ncbi:MAG: T9SS type A sorting domain-containing protein [Calditrichaeota bacterium]|nr:T9SS type A sorting domain-containing protein [Calditrichota bacterium]
MLKTFTPAVLLLMFALTGIGWTQWSQDPSEALNLPDIPHGYVVTTDSLGGAFIIGTGEDYSRTYCTHINRGGELGWDRWVTFMPGVDIDRALGPYVCPEPGYLIAVLFAEHHNDEDTLWEIRAQKVSLEGELMWPDSGVSVSDTRLRDEVTYTDMIGAESDGEGGLIILWKEDSYRIVGGGNRILERQSFRAQRLSSDGESLWGDNGVEVLPDVDGPANTHEIGGKLVSDGAGGVIMVYHQGGTQVRIIGGQRISNDGEKLWGDTGVLYELNSYLFIGEAVPDNHGGVLFSGQAAQNERLQVRVSRLDQNGDLLFGDGNGVVVKDVHYRDGSYLKYNYLTQASDSIFFVNWNGNTDEEPHSLVQAVNLTGDLVWDWPGLTVNDVDSICFTLTGVTSFQSVIYGWRAARPDSIRRGALYCQRIDMQGNRQWADEGVMLFDRRGWSVSNVITDCHGGAIFKISRYLQHINRDGELGIPLTIRGVDQPLAPGIIEYSLFPNPTNGATTISFLSPLVNNKQLMFFDLQGRLIFKGVIPAGVSSHPIDVSTYPSGSYILQMQTGAFDSQQMLNVVK